MKRKRLTPAQLRILRAVRNSQGTRRWWHYRTRSQRATFRKLQYRGYLIYDHRIVDGKYAPLVVLTPKGWAQLKEGRKPCRN
jgi:DNA-binding MarR family transcriptional regulator